MSVQGSYFRNFQAAGRATIAMADSVAAMTEEPAQNGENPKKPRFFLR